MGDPTLPLDSMPSVAYRAQIHVLEAPAKLHEGEIVQVPVRVRNATPHRWPAGNKPNAVRLAYHWLRQDGKVLVYDGIRTDFPTDIDSGAEVLVRATVQAPATPSLCTLEFDLVHENITWFKDRGSRVSPITVEIAGARPGDFGEYATVWENADFTRDYWSVVGVPSEEQFVTLGDDKLRMLMEFGLARNSRVLDVGCGTGLLTRPLHSFLDSTGRYCGTDIAEKPVAFCRQRYSRSTFSFTRNMDASLPLEIVGGPFDFVLFMSVLTHTYPHESRGLLTDATRCMGDGGRILADIFCAKDVSETRGTRALVEWNLNAFKKLGASIGLRMEILSEAVHEGETTRALLRLRR